MRGRAIGETTTKLSSSTGSQLRSSCGVVLALDVLLVFQPAECSQLSTKKEYNMIEIPKAHPLLVATFTVGLRAPVKPKSNIMGLGGIRLKKRA